MTRTPPAWVAQATHHVASQPWDDDEYWAVPREDGKWNIYAASPLGWYPEKPYETVDKLPSKFLE